MNSPVYESLVWVFYCNTELVSRQGYPSCFYNDRFKTYLMDKEIVVNRQVLATTLHLDDDGKTNTKANILDFAKMVFNDDSLPFPIAKPLN